MFHTHDGGRLHKPHCATCHGTKGFGDEETGRDFPPSPVLSTYVIKRRRSVDEYLLWSISDSGAQFGTEMPAFKEILTDQQIWQIVT
jgi:mono/diheme cytochrome c family protein